LDWHKYVIADPELFRPSEAHQLLGDPSKAKRELQWNHKTDFAELVREMVFSDCATIGVKTPASAAL
jgi:GDPmannose 4,6-dehydratase